MLKYTGETPTFLLDLLIEPYQVLSVWVRQDLAVMVRKGYSTLPKSPALLKPHTQMVLCHIQDTHWRHLALLQRSSLYTLQPQVTGPWNYNLILVLLLKAIVKWLASTENIYIYIYIYLYICVCRCVCMCVCGVCVCVEAFVA